VAENKGDVVIFVSVIHEKAEFRIQESGGKALKSVILAPDFCLLDSRHGKNSESGRKSFRISYSES
jgi:hypothetical protein